MNMTESVHTVNFNDALLAAANRAMAAFPQATARIKKGLALVQADAVADMTRCEAHWYTVRSASDPTQVYDVASNGRTVCSCPDYLHHVGTDTRYLCKHGFAILLVRAAKRDMACPRLRHAYHLSSGEEGHARFLSDGRAVFHPGGHKASVICDRSELCVGPFVAAPTPAL